MRKSLLLVALSTFVMASCGDKSVADGNKTAEVSSSVSELKFFGDSISIDGAVPSVEVSSKIEGVDSLPLKITGKIEEVCQKKGCWMTMDIGGGNEMRVKFKDYAFFVPKDAAGKDVIIDGYVYSETTSVEELKHYAEDEGLSKEEIEKITEPEVSISFEAHGVAIKN